MKRLAHAVSAYRVSLIPTASRSKLLKILDVILMTQIEVWVTTGIHRNPENVHLPPLSGWIFRTKRYCGVAAPYRKCGNCKHWRSLILELEIYVTAWNSLTKLWEGSGLLRYSEKTMTEWAVSIFLQMEKPWFPVVTTIPLSSTTVWMERESS